MSVPLRDFECDRTRGVIEKITVRWADGTVAVFQSQDLLATFAYAMALRLGVPCTCEGAPREVTPQTTIEELQRMSAPCHRHMFAYSIVPLVAGTLDMAAQYRESMGKGDGS